MHAIVVRREAPGFGILAAVADGDVIRNALVAADVLGALLSADPEGTVLAAIPSRGGRRFVHVVPHALRDAMRSEPSMSTLDLARTDRRLGFVGFVVERVGLVDDERLLARRAQACRDERVERLVPWFRRGEPESAAVRGVHFHRVVEAREFLFVELGTTGERTLKELSGGDHSPAVSVAMTENEVDPFDLDHEPFHKVSSDAVERVTVPGNRLEIKDACAGGEGEPLKSSPTFAQGLTHAHDLRRIPTVVVCARALIVIGGLFDARMAYFAALGEMILHLAKVDAVVSACQRSQCHLQQLAVVTHIRRSAHGALDPTARITAGHASPVAAFHELHRSVAELAACRFGLRVGVGKTIPDFVIVSIVVPIHPCLLCSCHHEPCGPSRLPCISIAV